MVKELLILRGIPASGKSTFAKSWIASGQNRVRVNRDDIRLSAFGVEYGCDENAVTKIEDAMIDAALRSGNSVVVDDTNTNQRYIKRIAEIGWRNGAAVKVKTFHVDLEEALRRNANRDRKVPENVIRDMHRRLKLSGDVVLEQFTAEQYVPDSSNPPAILVDLDGTLCRMDGGRGPYDWQRVGEDSLDPAVYHAIIALQRFNHIIIMSGRDSVCRPETKAWLARNVVPYDALFMRPAGDTRKDSIVKVELFDKHVRNNYNVLFALDDRNQVVDVYRRMGLKVFQVEPGDF